MMQTKINITSSYCSVQKRPPLGGLFALLLLPSYGLLVSFRLNRLPFGLPTIKYFIDLYIILIEQLKTNAMLNWTLTLLVIALIAGVLGFTGIAGTAVGIAKILFFIFLVLWIISLVARGFRSA